MITENYNDLVTVICLTSPSPCHPDTRIIDETLASVRHWFPTAPIYILADGVRPELEYRRWQYHDYLLKLASQLPSNFYMFPVKDHSHQTAMVKNALPHVKTPLLLFIEQDLPIRTDPGVDIDWQMMADAILSGSVDLCRLMLHESVHPEHLHLYQGQIAGYPHLWKQRQFSGWTHLASTEMYKRLLLDFDMRAKIMVERYVGRVIEARPWEDFKLTSYIPDPAASRRIYHLHGRGGVDGGADDPTFVETEVYPPK